MSLTSHVYDTIVTIVVLLRLTDVSVVEGQMTDRYIGCFYDIQFQSSISSHSNSLTIEKCITYCQKYNITYAAIQNGTTCFCRNDYGVQVPDNTCNVTCSGNSNEFCGGTASITVQGYYQLTYVVYSVCSVGRYGSMCDQGCHCRRDIPCDRMTGYCPDGCYGNWDGYSCNTTILSLQYMGCYADQVNRSMPTCINHCSIFSSTNTLETCILACANLSYSFAGTQYSVQCFCGESNYSTYGRLNETQCSMTCSGNANEVCGGLYANSVYSVCPAGNYGTLCTGRCNCFENAVCVYLDGSCPTSECRWGWTGDSCNIRNCTDNNGDCNNNETCITVNLVYASVNVCRCSEGYERSNLWENCTDIDECAKSVCNPITTTCFNTVGGYSCTCKDGFKRVDSNNCEDVFGRNATICDNDQGFSIGQLIGAAVGAAGGTALLFVLGIIVAVFFRRRRKHQSPDVKSEGTGTKQENQLPTPNYTSLKRTAAETDDAYQELN